MKWVQTTFMNSDSDAEPVILAINTKYVHNKAITADWKETQRNAF